MRNQRGVTLIALVITIIVLLILAGVSIAMLTGDNGILTQANQAKYETAQSEAKEKINLALNAVKTEVYAQRVTKANWNPATEGMVESPTDGALITVLKADGISKNADTSGATFNNASNDGKIVYTWDSTDKILTLSYFSPSKANLDGTGTNIIKGSINLDTLKLTEATK